MNLATLLTPIDPGGPQRLQRLGPLQVDVSCVEAVVTALADRSALEEADAAIIELMGAARDRLVMTWQWEPSPPVMEKLKARNARVWADLEAAGRAPPHCALPDDWEPSA